VKKSPKYRKIVDFIDEKGKFRHRHYVEEFIEQSPELSICADICNTFKHKELDPNKPPRSKDNPIGIFKSSSTTTIGPDPSMAKVSLGEFKVETDLGDVCCYTLAEKCIKEWDRYFSENGG
jgi:hypothetical protein